jgi:hypothetical protein
MAAEELVIWSPAWGRYLYCPPDEITWIGRTLLSAGQDRHLHRGTVCAGIRYVARQWELFNRDTSREIYLAQRQPETPPSAEVAGATARYVLPPATPWLEPYPVTLDKGEWLVGIGPWSVVLFVGVPLRDDDLNRGTGRHAQPAPHADRGGEQSRPTESTLRTDGELPMADAVSRVRAYFDKHGRVQMAMALYYQDFIEGKLAAQVKPMLEVAVALNLTNQTAIADYKKELQKHIWNQPSGHQRELAEFLIRSRLIDHSVLRRAQQLARANEQTGKTDEARQRLEYRPRRPET